MRRWQSWLGVVVFLTGVLVVSVGQSQDKGNDAPKTPARATKEPAEKSKSKVATKETKHRLPRYYAKLGLTDAQREKIYGAQDKYAAEIDKLEKQLADAKSKQEADCRKILNADQKKQLAEAVEAAKSKAAKSDTDEEE